MKRGLISLLISIFFAFLVIIILINYSPFDSEKLKEMITLYGVTQEDEFKQILGKTLELGLGFSLGDKGVLLAWILACMGFVVSFFSSLHLFIDKLFFKQYFEQPDIFVAVRRGILLFSYLFSFFVLRLLGVFEWYVFVITAILIFMIELLFVYLRKRKNS